jgi:hypothetical protein
MKTKSITFAFEDTTNVKNLHPSAYLAADYRDLGRLIDNTNRGFIYLASDPVCVKTMLEKICVVQDATSTRGVSFKPFIRQQMTLTELARALADWARFIAETEIGDITRKKGVADQALAEVYQCYKDVCTNQHAQEQLAADICHYFVNQGFTEGWFPLPNAQFLRGKHPVIIVQVTGNGDGVTAPIDSIELERHAMRAFGQEEGLDGSRRVRTVQFNQHFEKLQKQLGHAVSYFCENILGERKEDVVVHITKSTIERPVYVAEGQRVDLDRIFHPR